MTDWTTVLTSCIPAFIALVTAVITCAVTNSKITGLIVYRLDAIESKLTKLEDFTSDIAELKSQTAVHHTEIAALQNEVNRLLSKEA